MTPIATIEYRVERGEMFRTMLRYCVWRMAWYYPLALIVAAALVVVDERGGWLPAGLVVGYGVLAPYVVTWLTTKNAIEAPVNRRLVIMEFGDSVIVQRGGSFETRFEYADLVRVRGDRDGFQLFFAKANYVLVPYRVFRTEADWASVQGLFLAKGLIKGR